MRQSILFVVLLILSIACTDKKRVGQLEGQLDTVRTELNNKDSVINSYLAFVNNVEQNLNEIRERESMISLQREEVKAGDQETRDKIIKDLQTINTLMKENKETIATLHKSLNGSKSYLSELKNLVDQLKKSVDNKATEIDKLNRQMTYLMDENQMLKFQVDSLHNQSLVNESTIQNQSKKIEELDNALNTAYYATGTKEELKEKNIIEKEGGFLGIGGIDQLNDNLNIDKLSSIDIRSTYSIPIHSKKIEFVTEHPEDSYELIRDDSTNNIEKLVILDPEKFWASSKCLVAVTK